MRRIDRGKPCRNHPTTLLHVRIFLAILPIALHTHQPIGSLRLTQLAPGLAKPGTESFPGAGVGGEIPDLELGLGACGGDRERGVGGEGDGEDFSLQRLKKVRSQRAWKKERREWK